MDIIFLKTELKAGGDEIELLKARWQYGLVLVGLALHPEKRQDLLQFYYSRQA